MAAARLRAAVLVLATCLCIGCPAAATRATRYVAAVDLKPMRGAAAHAEKAEIPLAPSWNQPAWADSDPSSAPLVWMHHQAPVVGMPPGTPSVFISSGVAMVSVADSVTIGLDVASGNVTYGPLSTPPIAEATSAGDMFAAATVTNRNSTSNTTQLYAYSIATGTPLWATPRSKPLAVLQLYGDAASREVYVWGRDSLQFTLSRYNETGQMVSNVVWHPNATSIVGVADGVMLTIYRGLGEIGVANATTGEFLWTQYQYYRAPPPFVSQPDATAGTMAIAPYVPADSEPDWKAKVAVADLLTGTVKWKTPLPDGVTNLFAPVMAEGVVITSSAPCLMAYSARTGQPMWQYRYNGSLVGKPVITGQTAIVQVATSASVVPGTALCDFTLVVLDLTTGKTRWSFYRKFCSGGSGTCGCKPHWFYYVSQPHVDAQHNMLIQAVGAYNILDTPSVSTTWVYGFKLL